MTHRDVLAFQLGWVAGALFTVWLTHMLYWRRLRK